LGNKFFVSDCEGPISVNDNAFELAGYFIEDGEKFFQIISRYDDILVDEVKRPGYNAGDTLKLILPFLKAYGATNQNMEQFSSRNVLLIPGAQETLSMVNNLMPSFIVSTSYEPYIRALCAQTHFPFSHCYCTRLDLDKHTLSGEDRNKLKEFCLSITSTLNLIIWNVFLGRNPRYGNWFSVPGSEACRWRS
jgi:energy-converting hydrogenase A subunit R